MVFKKIFKYLRIKFSHVIKHIIKALKVLQLIRRGCICKLEGKEVLFYFPFIWTDDIQRSIFFSQKYYENDYLDYLCDEWHSGIVNKLIKDGIILDIGSNIGNHTLYFLLERGAKFVYCFEPAKETFKILERNVEINRLGDCTKLYNVGVGSASGNACVSMRKAKNTAYTQISIQKNGDLHVISIDDIGIKEKVDFIKVDVEGFELEVLKGMQELLKRDKPMMMIEIWKKNLAEVNEILVSIGYTIETMIDDGGHNGDYICYVSE